MSLNFAAREIECDRDNHHHAECPGVIEVGKECHRAEVGKTGSHQRLRSVWDKALNDARTSVEQACHLSAVELKLL